MADIVSMAMVLLRFPWDQATMLWRFPVGDQWVHGMTVLSELTLNFNTPISWQVL